MKRTIFLLLALLSMTMGWSRPIDRRQALALATDFMARHGQTLRTQPSRMMRGKQMNDGEGTATLYVFNTADGRGFVVVSGDDECDPILGYSLESSYDEDTQPEALRAWLEGASQAIEQGRVQKRQAPTYKAIQPFITTRWNQGEGTTTGFVYNTQCPTYQNRYCLTGCVATAMAQIMNYYRWPQAPTTAVPEYKTNATLGMLDALPPTTFDWDHLCVRYIGNESDDEIKAVAQLMRYCGQAAKMNYGTGSSGANAMEALKGLTSYFDYDRYTGRLVYRSSYSIDGWNALLYSELQEGRPVLYSGYGSTGGHAFVCDGYDGNGFFHFNWGWGGHGDGYYKTYDTDSNRDGLRQGYGQEQLVLVGIQPNTGVVPDIPIDDDDEVPTEMVAHVPSCKYENQLLTLMMGNMWSTSTQAFAYGIGKLETDGSITPLLTQTNYYETYQLAQGYYFTLNFDLTSANLPVGIHQLVPISRQQGKGWLRCTPYKLWIEVEVKRNGSITATVHPLVNLTITANQLSNYQPYTNTGVALDIENNGDDYTDAIYGFLTDETNTPSLVFYEKLQLKAGATKQVGVAFNNGAEGLKTLTLFTDYQQKNLIFQQQFRVRSSLQITGSQLIGNGKMGSKQTLELTFSNGGDEANVPLYLLENKGTAYATLASAQVSVPAGGQATVPMFFVLNEEGEHTLLVAYDMEGKNIAKSIDVSITGPTGQQNQLSCEQFSVQPDNITQCTLKVKNIGTNTFNDHIIANLWETTSSGKDLYLDYCTLDDKTIATGGTQTYTFCFEGLEEGKNYKMHIYYPASDNTDAVKWLVTNHRFSVTTTGIDDLKNEASRTKNASIYDPTGRRIASPQRVVAPGIYIVNGKKVLMK